MERKAIREQQLPPKRCPRCESTDTKFCYYNNYTQSQPRHYCKACRRYWTEGGRLRSVPPGGGGRRIGSISSRRQKNKATTRSPSTSPTPAPAAAASVPAGPVVAVLSAGPEGPALPPPPPAPLFFMDGGLGEGLMGLQGGNGCQRFHPGAGGIMVGLAEQQTAMMPLMLPPEPLPQRFINFSVPQLQQNLLPPGMMNIHPSTRLPDAATVFTAAGPSATVTAAAGYDGEELGFWSNVFGNGGGSSGVPPPPTSSAPF